MTNFDKKKAAKTIETATISQISKLIFLAMVDCCNSAVRTNTCFMSVGTLTKRFYNRNGKNYSKRTIQNSLKQLREIGLVKKIERFGRDARQLSNVWFVFEEIGQCDTLPQNREAMLEQANELKRIEALIYKKTGESAIALFAGNDNPLNEDNINNTKSNSTNLITDTDKEVIFAELPMYGMDRKIKARPGKNTAKDDAFFSSFFTGGVKESSPLLTQKNNHNTLLSKNLCLTSPRQETKALDLLQKTIRTIRHGHTSSYRVSTRSGEFIDIPKKAMIRQLNLLSLQDLEDIAKRAANSIDQVAHPCSYFVNSIFRAGEEKRTPSATSRSRRRPMQCDIYDYYDIDAIERILLSRC